RYRLNDLLLLYLRQHSEGTLQGYTETLFKLLTSRGQYRTARAYRTVTHGLLSFHGDTHLSLKQIDARLMKDFESHLKNKGLMLNTISYYMRNLRAIYNKAVQENLIIARKEEDPFADVFTGVVKTVKRALSMDETSQLLNVDLEKHLCDEQPGSSEHTQLKKLQDAQRYFNFCLYARGMCFVDLAYLKKSDIKDGCIRYMRKKTGQRIEVEIAPALQTIIDSFADETSDSPYVFPLIRHADKPSLVQYESALRTQNNRLKRLATMAGITKTLSTHVARHTWATVGKLINLSTMVLSECLGHSSEKTTSIYLGTLAGSTLDEANARVIQAIQNHRVRV
ncbi:site-specific integrase, partial [Bacteroides sp. 51]|uniref:tyrosine-type recombinase/integrase n=1 Tax=Bacteroides sp. 51 TaxID=2302938 RepID=UPI0013D881B7